MSRASADGLELGSVEEAAELSIAGKDEAEHESRVHVEVGEEAEQGEHVGPQILSLVNDENGSEAVIVGESAKAILELSHDHVIGAPDVETGGGGHLRAEVAFGERGELDEVDAISGLGKRGAEATQEHGLAGAGRCHEDSAHSLLHGVLQSHRPTRARGTKRRLDRKIKT